MSEQMDFNDGKYTVISDNGRLTALRHGEPWGRDLTGDNLIYWMLMEAIRLKEERDASAAKLAELEGQEPVAWMGFGPRDGRAEFSISRPAGSVMRDFNMRPIFARPVPTESAPKAVRLTDEEIFSLDNDSVFLGNVKEIARAIESAVLRKNGIEVAE